VSQSETIAADIQTTTVGGNRKFWINRLSSLLAVAPLSLWTINHLWDNLAAFGGAASWQESVTSYSSPVTFAATALMVWLPLVLHTVWGVGRLFSFKPNIQQYRNFGNLKYMLQRVTAIGVLFFIPAHAWLAFLSPRLQRGRPELFSELAGQMHWHLPTLLVYLLGTLGVAYHLANGLWSFSMGWGLAVGKQALKRVNAAAIIFFLILLAMSWGVLFAMYQAGAAFPPAE
jgi:succinate dehydrogenase / fumarate reductase cytochrome b subunit